MGWYLYTFMLNLSTQRAYLLQVPFLKIHKHSSKFLGGNSGFSVLAENTSTYRLKEARLGTTTC